MDLGVSSFLCWLSLAIRLVVIIFILTRATLGNAPVFLNSWGSYGNGAGQFNNPTGIALASDGDVFVVDSYNNRVQRFDAYGNYETQWGALGSGPGQLGSPWGIAVNSSGQVYVADSDNVRVQRFDSNGTFQDEWGQEDFSYPAGVAVNRNGQVYVADGSLNRVLRFDADGNLEGYWGSDGTGAGQFNWPVGVAVDSSGRIYVADTQNERIQRFDEWGAYQLQWGSDGSGDGQFSAPRGVAISANDLVYVADTNNQRIQRFDSNGYYQAQWGGWGSGNGQFQWPDGVAVGDTGLVYVITGDNRIQRFFDYASWVDPASHYLPDAITFDSYFDLDRGKHLYVPNATMVADSTGLSISGGSLHSGSLDLNTNSTLYYSGGDLDVAMLDGGLLYVLPTSAGTTLHVGAGRTFQPRILELFGSGNLVVNGGSLIAGESANIQTGSAVWIEAGTAGAGEALFNQGDITLANAFFAKLTAPTLYNEGVLGGSGRIDGQLANGAAGEVRIAAGQRMRLLGEGVHTNGGQIELSGNPNVGGFAEIELDGQLLNLNGATITGRDAAIRFGGLGLINAGTLSTTAGTNDVFGNIANELAGKIIVTGGSHTTFHDDVMQDGVLKVSKVGSTNSVAVFLGNVIGIGGNGGGDIFFEGEIHPGSGPALVAFENDISLGFSAALEIELGGTTQGSEYDAMDITGILGLGGTLNATPIDLGSGLFEPNEGDVFEILTATGGITGDFAAMNLPSLSGDLYWNVLRDSDSLALEVVAPSLPGDFNHDASVDAADYVVWRKNPGGIYTADDYNSWRTNFGATLASGSATLPLSSAIPEPTSALLLLFVSFAAIGVWTRRRRCH